MAAATKAVALSANFEPEDGPSGFIEWTFLVPATSEIGAGVFEISFDRLLSAAEREGDLSGLLGQPK